MSQQVWWSSITSSGKQGGRKSAAKSSKLVRRWSPHVQVHSELCCSWPAAAAAAAVCLDCSLLMPALQRMRSVRKFLSIHARLALCKAKHQRLYPWASCSSMSSNVLSLHKFYKFLLLTPRGALKWAIMPNAGIRLNNSLGVLRLLIKFSSF